MSDLATVSAEIAPYLALAANSLGTSVIAQAQQRIAEGTVAAGEGFFRRLLHRGGGDLGDGTDRPPLDTSRADALDELLADLDDQERRLLSHAVTAWLDAPADQRDAPRLMAHISRLASDTGARIVYNTPTATGKGGVAAINIGTLNMGGGTGTQDGS